MAPAAGHTDLRWIRRSAELLHRLSKGGLLMGVPMALISVAGVTAHQLITAGPRRSRAERDQAWIDRAVSRREKSARRLRNDADRQPARVDRAAVVVEIADQIRDAVRAGEVWHPNYSALMAATGFKRSWCEKVVHDARSAVLELPARTDDDDRTG